MKAHLYRWAIVGLGLAVLAVAAQAGASATASGKVKVDVQAENSGRAPQVRILVNGKEVESGEVVPLDAVGEVQIETDADGACVRGEKPEVRMWINGKEVQPGMPIALGEGAGGWVSIQEPGDPDRPGRKGGAVLGISVGPLDDRIAEKADVKTGAVVLEVLPGTPAEATGLRPGDVVTSVDDKPVESPQHIVEMIGNRRAGDEVRLGWSRGGERMEKTVTLARREGGMERRAFPPGEDRAKRDRRPLPEARHEGFLGVGLQGLTDQTREIAGTDKGALIANLTDDSPAAKAGLQAGDVITRIGDTEIEGPGQLADLIRGRKPGDRIHVVYFRMGKRHEAEVTLGERPGSAEGGEGGSTLDPYKDVFDSDALREYLKELQPRIQEWAKRFQEWQGQPRPGAPDTRRDMPEPGRPSYDVGKDMGRILERLERLEQRLNEIEKRLDRGER